MKVVHSHVGGQNTRAVLLRGGLLSLILQKLQDKRRIKVAMDGKHRLAFHGYVLLTVGLLVKTYSRASNRFAFSEVDSTNWACAWLTRRRMKHPRSW